MKVGIIGGNFGAKVLLPAALANHRIDIVGVSFSSKSESNFDPQLGHKIFSNRDLIHNNEIEMLLIAVPPKNQYLIMQEAIKKNIHLFIEKPLFVNSNFWTEKPGLFETKFSRIYINYIFKELSEFIFIQNYINEKGLENVISYEFNWNCYSKSFSNGIDNWRFHSDLGGGGLSNLMSHFFALFQLFFGNVSQVEAELNNFRGEKFFFDESSGKIRFFHHNGIIGNINFNACSMSEPEITFKITFKSNLILLKNNNLNYFKKFQLEVDKKIIRFDDSASIDFADDPRIALVNRHLDSFLNKLETNTPIDLNYHLAYKINNILSMVRKQLKK